ncbi:MFS transporter [Amnibacterium setariae]|uniref:MFS transporter n=2 Tax=Amnibacterium setariae TaxID=2306585 RepID=A0A3A1U3B1_9MICO|nr:MFS transporter [Amnibacterium setariae]
MATSEFVVAGLLPEVAADFDIGVAQAGLAITWFAIGMIVGTPVMVLTTLRLPRRSVLVLALLVFAAGHVVAALSGSFVLLLAARFLTAVATGAFWAISGLVAADAAGPAASGRALGVIGAGGMLANVVGVPLGSLAGQVAGWRGPFWALAVLAALAAVVIARLVPHDRAAHRPTRVRDELVALRSGRLWLVLLACAAVAGGTLSVFSFVSPLLTDRTGLPATAVPLALVLFGLGALAGTLLGGRLGDAAPTATVLGAMAVTLAAVIALGAVSTMPVPTLVVFGVLGLAGLSANPILGYLAIRFGGSAPTLASALTPSAFNLGTAVGTAVAAAALTGPLEELAPIAVGATSAALALVVFGALVVVQRSGKAAAAALPGEGREPRLPVRG